MSRSTPTPTLLSLVLERMRRRNAGEVVEDELPDPEAPDRPMPLPTTNAVPPKPHHDPETEP